MSKASPVESWKQSKKPIEVEVPSGNVALVRRPEGIQLFLQKGMIPNSLMPIIDQALNEQEVDESKLFTDLLKDSSQLEAMLEMIDSVVCHCVVDPQVLPVPSEDAQRDDALLYVDEVEMNDKMFIFNFAVGGTKSLETFRSQQDQSVAALAAVTSMEREAE